jgi:glycosyltransferase involved in cell wall biosynthesis
MRRRLVILTEIIAPYRIPVFNALAARCEIELHVIFLSRTDTSTRQWRVYEDEIRFSYEVLPCWRRRIGKYNLLLNANVASALYAAAPDVVVCGGYNYLAAWQAMNWAKRNQVPFLLWSESTAQDRRKQHFPVEWLKHKFLRNCDGFVVPGRSAQEYLQQFVSRSRQIFLARNAVDIELFATKCASIRTDADRLRGELALPARYFLYVGRLVRSKGVFDLIRAYAALPANLRAEVSLVFAGDGPMRPELEAQAREIYPGAAHFVGFIQRDDLASYYALAECLVVPTHTDPWGLVVNEAMACGLPVICTAVAGCAADLVRDNGILVRPGDVMQLAQAMQQIANDSELRQSMSRHSADLIRNFSPEACAAGFAEATLCSGATTYA